MASEDEERDGSSTIYKMKVVQFLDRSVPIILQNDNGPCPLLAISNVLLLRNNVTLSLDILEISQRELMSLVAEWLLDANSNVQNRDDEFVKNQQQNIGDAIQLLPRLATGIDVNVRFRHIHDFEYTPECAIFDLFHVGLVHGWLCDPQDEVTFRVIGSNSYNTLQEKLVALQAMKGEQASPRAVIEDEPTVDFAAATIASLGVPTPHMKILSDDEFEVLNQAAGKARRKGDEEEAAELLQALQLSQTDNESVLDTSSEMEVLMDFQSDQRKPAAESGIPHLELISVAHVDEDGVESVTVANEVLTIQPRDEITPSANEGIPELIVTSIVHVKGKDDSSLTDEVLEQDFVFTSAESAKEETSHDVAEEHQLPSLKLWLKSAADDGLGSSEKNPPGPTLKKSVREGDGSSDTVADEGGGSMFTIKDDVKTAVDPLCFDAQEGEEQTLSTSGSMGSSFEHVPLKDDKISIDTGSGHLSEEAEDCASSGLDDDEPLYEGERRLTESRMTSVGDTEPFYEGEDVTAESAGDHVSGDGSGQQPEEQKSGDENRSVAMTEGLIIENFLSSTASQLSYHGLFSLQDGLKNNELYVFFRNNHFSTIFKYDGQIYLLATDQGYLAQPDLVWEKLTEVDGDTVFATGSFHQFQVDQSSGTWNERDAVAATATFLSSQQITGTSVEGASYSSDLQLAMALQQQELAQQQQQREQQQHARSQSSAPRSGQPSAKSSTIGAGRLVTGPPRSSVPPPKQDKAKDKCNIM